MSNIVTRWVLELGDKLSAPIKTAQSQIDATSKSWAKVGEAAGDTIETISEQLKIERNDLKLYQSSLKKVEAQLDKLHKAAEKAPKGGNKYAAIQKEITTLQAKSEGYRKSISETEAEIKRLGASHDKLAAKKKSWGDLMLAINQTLEVTQKVTSALSYGETIDKAGKAIQQMTGVTGDSLTALNRKSYLLSEQFGDDQMDIVRSANAMSKAFNITFGDALAQLEAGYSKGANLNGDMLEQVREYSSQMKQLGLGSGEMLALMSKANKDGVFNDKALDSIKEANLSIREMGQAQVNALHAIGLKSKDLAGKTTMEIVQLISKAMDGKSIQAQQLVIADIFKGAGEDAGLEWIKGLASVDMDINNVESVKAADSSLKEWMGKLKFWFADSFSAISANASTIGAMASVVGTMIPLYQALAGSTTLATIAQWAMNAAVYANPYVLLAMGIAALIGGVVALVVKFEDFSGWIKRTWQEGGALTKTIMVLAGVLLLPLAPLYALAAGINKVRQYWDELVAIFKTGMKGIVKWLTGDFSGAVDEFKNAGRQISDVYDQEFGLKQKKTVSIAERVAEAMRMKNSSIVSQMKNAGKIHGSAYVDEKIKQAERWAAYLDKINKTDIYSKRVAAVKKEYFSSVKEDRPTVDGKLINTGAKSDGLSVSGTGGKGIIMNLKFDQHFHAIKGGADVGKIADEVAGLITDRLRDALVSS